MLQTSPVATSPLEENPVRGESTPSPFAPTTNANAQHLLVLLTAAHHYAKKLDADQSHLRPGFGHYSQAIDTLVSNLQNQIQE